MARIAHLAPEVANVALAVEETITSPAPGLGHGRLGDLAAIVTLTLTTLHVF